MQMLHQNQRERRSGRRNMLIPYKGYERRRNRVERLKEAMQKTRLVILPRKMEVSNNAIKESINFGLRRKHHLPTKMTVAKEEAHH